MKAVIYARVSSREQEETGYSLESQEALLKDYAVQKGFTVAKVYKVSESASGKRIRKEFVDMLQFVTDAGINVILCEKIDRLTRNLKDAATASDWILESNDRAIHFVKENFVVSKNTRAHENLVWDMKVAMARFYTNNLSEEVKKGQTAKLAAGQLPYRSPLGYRTVGESGKKVHVIDEVTGPLVRKMFEMYATGNYSVVQLTKEMNKMGLCTQTGKKLSKSPIYELLTNPFYYGDIVWTGKIYKGAHEPLISLELFNQVQQKLNRKLASPYFRTHAMRYKGKLMCGECGRTVTWERQKGKIYGACKHCKTQLGLKGKYVHEEDIDTLIKQHILEVAPTNERVLAVLNKALKEDAKDEINLYEAKKQGIQTAIDRGDKRVDTAYTDRLDGRISPDRYDGIKTEWDGDRKALVSELKKLGEDKSLYYDAGFSIHILAERTQKIYDSEHVLDEDRRLLLSYAFSNLAIKHGKLTVEYTPTFDFLRIWVPTINKSLELTGNSSNKKRNGENDHLLRAVLGYKDSNLDTQDQNLMSYH